MSAGTLGWLRQQLTLTSLLSAAFIGYFGFSLSKLYRVAVPLVPSIYRDDGTQKPTIESLWNQASGLDMQLWLSTSATHDPRKSLLLFEQRDLSFDWALDVTLDLVLEFVAPSGKPLRLRARCDDSELPIQARCLTAAAAWSALNASRAALDQALVVGEWSGESPRNLRKALRQGLPVYAHTFVAWSGKPFAPGAVDFSPLRATNARADMVQVWQTETPRGFVCRVFTDALCVAARLVHPPETDAKSMGGACELDIAVAGS